MGLDAEDFDALEEAKMSVLEPRGDGDLHLEVDLPEKEELLFQDPILDFQEYEDYIKVRGEKL